MEKEYLPNKKAGEAFLAANKSKAGVITTASGLQYQVIKKGNGPLPTDTSRVKVNYVGTLIDGTEFDSSAKHGGESELYLNGVIKGWSEGLQLMPVGSKYKFFIPQELAYGVQGQGQIKPFSALIFEVELVSIEK
jgi:FKBP-type peptidyl-prolyl cis-trans isomerase FklB